jgi:cytochrome c biogenesis protein ResB
LKRFFSTSFAGIYILVFAVSIGVATFIENDFGTSSAMKLVYQARWFEVLLTLFCITLVVNVVKYKMIAQKRWPLVIFHLSMVMILVGAGITRYFSYEGTMHIREGESSNTILSRDTYLNFQASSNGSQFSFLQLEVTPSRRSTMLQDVPLELRFKIYYLTQQTSLHSLLLASLF